MIKKMVVLSVDITEKQGVTALHPAYLHQLDRVKKDLKLRFQVFFHCEKRNGVFTFHKCSRTRCRRKLSVSFLAHWTDICYHYVIT